MKVKGEKTSTRFPQISPQILFLTVLSGLFSTLSPDSSLPILLPPFLFFSFPPQADVSFGARSGEAQQHKYIRGSLHRLCEPPRPAILILIKPLKPPGKPRPVTLSLSLSHLHTHTHTYPKKEKKKNRTSVFCVPTRPPPSLLPGAAKEGVAGGVGSENGQRDSLLLPPPPTNPRDLGTETQTPGILIYTHSQSPWGYVVVFKERNPPPPPPPQHQQKSTHKHREDPCPCYVGKPIRFCFRIC